MEIRLENCKNIREGKIVIDEGKLNIKYGINGTGKSSIAAAVMSTLHEQYEQELVPYHADNLLPSVSIIPNELSSIMLFDDKYISQFLFRDDNVLDEGKVYEVLIKDEALESLKNELLDLFENLKQAIDTNPINQLLSKANQISNELKLNADKTKIDGKSKAFKSIKDGNVYLRDNIPMELENYRDILSGEYNSSWVDWFGKGHHFSDDCPYCRAELPEDFNYIVELIKSRYKKSDVTNATKFFNSINTNFSFLKDGDLNVVTDRFTSASQLNQEDPELLRIIGGIELIRDSIEKLKNMDEYEMLNESSTDEKLNTYIEVFDEMTLIEEPELSASLLSIKESIETIVSSRTIYIQKKGMFESNLAGRVRNSQNRINNFMEISGIPYKVEICNSHTNKPTVILKHTSNKIVNDILSGLSYGEKNAFALIMFMMDVSSVNPKLVIIDDPISSFDENKKYAIINAMFLRRDQYSLKNKTVLMLTHDFTPIIDLVKAKRYDFAKANYIKNENGILSEYVIERDDIKSVIKVSEDSMNNDNLNVITRMIHYRRYLELTSDVDDLKYNMISSLLHLYNEPQKMPSRDVFIPFTEDEKSMTQRNIDDEFGYDEFSYDGILEQINNIENLIYAYESGTNYEKVNIVRVIGETTNNQPIENSVIEKFINESYHIENTMTFQLDPQAYNNVPQYIVNACDEYVNRFRNTQFSTSRH